MLYKNEINAIRNNKGNLTIEMACIMPIILSVIILLVYIAIFFYNKNCIQKIACIGMHKGLQLEHDSSGTVQMEIEKYIEKEVNERLIFSPEVSTHVKVKLMSIGIEIHMQQNLPLENVSQIMKTNRVFYTNINLKANRIDPAKVLWLGQ